MNKLKKALEFAAFVVFLLVLSLLFKPVRTWASQEGTYYWSYLYLKLITTANRRTCNSSNEGGWMYDSTVHSPAYCDGTSWHKAVTGTSTADSWTSY